MIDVLNAKGHYEKLILRFQMFSTKKKVALGLVRMENATRQAQLMHFQVKIPEHGTKKISRDKQTTKNVLQISFDVKALQEKPHLFYWTLSIKRNKQGTVYVRSVENHQNNSKIARQWSER